MSILYIRDSAGNLVAVPSIQGPAGADGKGAVADYVRTEAERVAKQVQSRQNQNTVSFLAGADIHARLDLTGDYSTDQMLESVQHAAQAMEIIRNQVHMDFGAFLGDFLWNDGETSEQAMEIFRRVKENLSSAFGEVPAFWAKGDADMLGNASSGEVLTDNQVFAGIGVHNFGAVFDEDNKAKGWCYRDFEEYQLRVIVMNTDEDLMTEGISDIQLAWLVEAMGVSALGADWRIIILSHKPLDWWGGDTELIETVDAFSSKILCNIHGHVHNFTAGLLDGTTFPRIAVPNMDFYLSNHFLGSDSYGRYGQEATYSRESGTCNDTSFCVFTIDPAEMKLYADCYGAGYDRIVDLSTGEILAE